MVSGSAEAVLSVFTEQPEAEARSRTAARIHAECFCDNIKTPFLPLHCRKIGYRSISKATVKRKSHNYAAWIGKMLRSKAALRIFSYFVLLQSCQIFAYCEACDPLLCSYRGGSLSHKTTPVQAHRGFRIIISIRLGNVNERAGSRITCN